TTTCTTHGTYLLTICPGCDKPFRAPRHGLLRPVGSTTICGNSRRARGQHCRTDLSALTAPPADTQCLARQKRYDTAVAENAATVFGDLVPAIVYHQALRSLTVLLLHITTAT